MAHVVRTTHIQHLIENGLRLAKACDGQQVFESDDTVPLEEPGLYVSVVGALEKASADLRHAAEELEAERLSCQGWPQV